jgi:acetamidase/formamidase
MGFHRLKANTTTTRAGSLQGGLAPVLTVRPGDTIDIETLPSGTKAEFENAPVSLLDEHKAILDGQDFGPGPHIVTGPIRVEGAEPGDTLVVRLKAARVRQDWGWNGRWPGRGALPDDIAAKEILFVPFERRRVAVFPWGQRVKLRPFFGLVATAPATELGRVTTVEPREFGGNLDNRDLVPGSTLYLPVFENGAGLFVGDGHALQGDGEVTQTALEASLWGRITVDLIKNTGLKSPRAESKGKLIVMGFDPDLDIAAQHALRDIVRWMASLTGLSFGDAFVLFGSVGELRVTQLVDGNKGIHAVIARRHLPRPPKRNSAS